MLVLLKNSAFDPFPLGEVSRGKGAFFEDAETVCRHRQPTNCEMVGTVLEVTEKGVLVDLPLTKKEKGQ